MKNVTDIAEKSMKGWSTAFYGRRGPGDGSQPFLSMGDFLCEVALPNREISLVYNKEILRRMENIIPQATAISIQEAAFSG